MAKKKLGFALTGSFCTWAEVIPIMKSLSEDYEIYPIMSPIGYETDTRFGKAADWIDQVNSFCEHPIIHTVEQAEPIGPRNLLDIMIIAPCTGNTLSKIANGITDTSVTMAAKASLRNGNPLVLAASTNDGLSACAKNIGVLLNTKNVYFVPMSQDDPIKKPTSIVAHFSDIKETLKLAGQGEQIQPVCKQR